MPPPPRRRRLPIDLPAVLSWAILLFQAILPWTASHFLTQDGPSHLYTGVVSRSLFLEGQHSPFAAAYQFQNKFVPNCGSAILFGGMSLLVGASHTEQMLASLLMLLGFAAFAYAARTWSPLGNALFTSYFLFKGFYNFYFGMGLMVLLTGYYLRHRREFTWRRAAVLGVGLLVLFFVHLIPTAVALLVIGVLAVWEQFIVLRSRDWRPLLQVSAAFAPAVLLLLIFASQANGGEYRPEVLDSWFNFPRWTWVVTTGRIGRLEMLHPVILFYILAGLFLMHRREWRTAAGGLAAAAMAIFGLYLFMPDTGYGGDEAKVRFAWGMYLTGGLLTQFVVRLRRLRLVMSLYCALFVVACLSNAYVVNRGASRLIDDYLGALRAIPAGSTFIRIRYNIPHARDQYGIPGDIPADPLYHRESEAAAAQRALNLSDYQAPNSIFPVILKPVFSGEQQQTLWNIENGGNDGVKRIKMLLETLPVKVQYVVVLGEASAPEPNDLKDLLALLTSRGMQQVSAAGNETFVRVFHQP